MNYRELLHQALNSAVLAGQEILNIYDTDFEVQFKDDKSPVTLADKKASDIIMHELEKFQIPVLSEEELAIPYETRKNWPALWIIDPLDGTKEFVKRNGEFTVNIALVEQRSPTIGIIYSPVFKDIYFAAKGLGAFKIKGQDFVTIKEQIDHLSLDDLIEAAQKLPLVSDRKNYVVLASRSHMSAETYQHIENLKLKHQQVDITTTGSSIKMCWVAEGIADEYPRFGPTMEWDTAAGQAILQEANAHLIDCNTSQPMIYNKQSLFNNWFIAKRN